MFPEVSLPRCVRGRLFLHSMPGWNEPLEETVEQLKVQGMCAIICLAADDEIRKKSPDYWSMIEDCGLPCPLVSFPIPDFGVPDDRSAYRSVVCDAVSHIQSGADVLIHCGAGVGRTGMFAECVLLALGETPAAAREAVSAAGSRAETDGQLELISWFAAKNGADR